MNSFEEKINPELRELLRSIPVNATADLSLEAMQDESERYYHKAVKTFVPNKEILIENKSIPRDDGSHLQIRIYQPLQKRGSGPLPVLLWFHGGGFFMGALGMDDAILQRFSLECQYTVVSVGYRLAPQHPFPAGFNDGYTALRWLSSTGVKDLNIDPDCLVVGGMSAGGCLAAGVALRARDEDGPTIKAQFLIIPVLDDRHETPSSKTIVDPRVWHRDLSLRAWSAYLKTVEGTVPAFAAPARANDLWGLPPAFISVEEQDLLRDEALLYAQRLMQSDVNTELHVYPGTFHGSILSFPDAQINQQHMADIVRSLKSLEHRYD